VSIPAILPSTVTGVARFSLAAGRPRVREGPVEAAEEGVAEPRGDEVGDLADAAGFARGVWPAEVAVASAKLTSLLSTVVPRRRTTLVSRDSISFT